MSSQDPLTIADLQKRSETLKKQATRSLQEQEELDLISAQLASLNPERPIANPSHNQGDPELEEALKLSMLLNHSPSLLQATAVISSQQVVAPGPDSRFVKNPLLAKVTGYHNNCLLHCLLHRILKNLDSLSSEQQSLLTDAFNKYYQISLPEHPPFQWFELKDLINTIKNPIHREVLFGNVLRTAANDLREKSDQLPLDPPLNFNSWLEPYDIVGLAKHFEILPYFYDSTGGEAYPTATPIAQAGVSALSIKHTGQDHFEYFEDNPELAQAHNQYYPINYVDPTTDAYLSVCPYEHPELEAYKLKSTLEQLETSIKTNLQNKKLPALFKDYELQAIGYWDLIPIAPLYTQAQQPEPWYAPLPQQQPAPLYTQPLAPSPVPCIVCGNPDLFAGASYCGLCGAAQPKSPAPESAAATSSPSFQAPFFSLSPEVSFAAQTPMQIQQVLDVFMKDTVIPSLKSLSANPTAKGVLIGCPLPAPPFYQIDIRIGPDQPLIKYELVYPPIATPPTLLEHQQYSDLIALKLIKAFPNYEVKSAAQAKFDEEQEPAFIDQRTKAAQQETLLAQQQARDEAARQLAEEQARAAAAAAEQKATAEQEVIKQRAKMQDALEKRRQAEMEAKAREAAEAKTRAEAAALAQAKAQAETKARAEAAAQQALAQAAALATQVEARARAEAEARAREAEAQRIQEEQTRVEAAAKAQAEIEARALAEAAAQQALTQPEPALAGSKLGFARLVKTVISANQAGSGSTAAEIPEQLLTAQKGLAETQANLDIQKAQQMTQSGTVGLSSQTAGLRFAAVVSQAVVAAAGNPPPTPAEKAAKLLAKRAGKKP